MDYSSVPSVMRNKQMWLMHGIVEGEYGCEYNDFYNPTSMVSSTPPFEDVSYGRFDDAMQRVQADEDSCLYYVLDCNEYAIVIPRAIDPSTNEVHESVRSIVGALGSYTEIDKGDGALRIVFTINENDGEYDCLSSCKCRNGIEICEQGNEVKVTGNVVMGYKEIKDCSNVIDEILNNYVFAP